MRVSSNPAVPHAVRPAEAMALLARLRDVEGHELLHDDVSLVVSPHVDRGRVVSHRQVTDAHLLAVARATGRGWQPWTWGCRCPSRGGRDDEAIALIGARL